MTLDGSPRLRRQLLPSLALGTDLAHHFVASDCSTMRYSFFDEVVASADRYLSKFLASVRDAGRNTGCIEDFKV